MKIAPSILAADHLRLGEQVASAMEGGADWIHVDVMDGLFVPNITVGVPVVKSLSRRDLFQDVHLMIQGPRRFFRSFAESGASAISFHVEAEEGVEEAVDALDRLGCLSGIAIKPETPLDLLDPVLERVGLVVVMSVSPGFGGQAFIPESVERVEALAATKSRRGLGFEIEVDGGVVLSNAGVLAQAGATVLVSGSGIFGQGDPAGAVRRMRAAAS